jgi:N-acetylmuramoyl-L-alanine amidase
MTRPIAKPANVSARPRRRQGSSPLFRTALVLALVVTCVLATPVVLAALRSAKSPLGEPDTGQAVLPGLAPGACMSFAAASGHAAKTVFIDPGHGGPDPGVVGTTGTTEILEKTVALSVGLRLSQMLRSDGYRVVLSRTSDTTVVKLGDSDTVNGAMTDSAVHRDLLARVACANASSAAVLVSIHFDAFDDPSVAGAETFYDAARPFSGANAKLAADLQTALVAGVGMTDRGVWTDDGVGTALTAEGNLYDHLVLLGPPASGWVDQPTAMPGALVEPLFLTNITDAKYAAEASGQQRIAAALHQGVTKFFSGA